MNYLISFPARAMQVPAEELAAVGEAAREVIREAKADLRRQCAWANSTV